LDFNHIFRFLRAEVAISFECLWQIGEQHALRQGPISQMPAEAHRYLVQALVLAGSSGKGNPLRDRYWNQVSKKQN
jgi:hypothetical protein